MPFKPYTEEEAKANSRTLLPKGIYPFSIHAAHDTTKEGAPLVSAKGNAMIRLALHVHREDGGIQFVDDFAVDSPKMAWKNRHLAQTTDTIAAFDAGDWDAATLEGKQGYAALDIENEKPKADGSGSWPAKNVVKDYGQGTVGGDTRASGNQPAFQASRPQPTEEELANQGGAKPGDGEEVPF